MEKNKRGFTNMTNEMSKDERLEELSYLFNRATGQLKEHFELVEEDFDKLFELENKMRNNHLSYGCGDLDEVKEVLSKDYGTNGWNHNFYYLDDFTKSMVYLSYHIEMKLPQFTEGKYKGPESKEYFYKYLWNDYVRKNLQSLSKLDMVDIDLLLSLLNPKNVEVSDFQVLDNWKEV